MRVRGPLQQLCAIRECGNWIANLGPMVRLFRSVAAALFTASAAIALAEQPQISETSLLLPYFSGTRPVRSVLSISSGCWQWLSPNGLGIISVEPTPTAECSDGTSSSATVTVASKNLKRSAAVVLAKNAAGTLACSLAVGLTMPSFGRHRIAANPARKPVTPLFCRQSITLRCECWPYRQS